MLLLLSVLILAGCGGGAGKSHFRKWGDEIRQMHMDDPEFDWESSPVAPEYLIEGLKDAHWWIRCRSAFLLGDMGQKMADRTAVPPLIATLKDENYLVRRNAAVALGNIRDKRAVKPLIEVLLDKYQSVCGWARLSLKKITGQDFGEDHEKWRNWYEKSKDK